MSLLWHCAITCNVSSHVKIACRFPYRLASANGCMHHAMCRSLLKLQNATESTSQTWPETLQKVLEHHRLARIQERQNTVMDAGTVTGQDTETLRCHLLLQWGPATSARGCGTEMSNKGLPEESALWFNVTHTVVHLAINWIFRWTADEKLKNRPCMAEVHKQRQAKGLGVGS